MPDVEPVRIPIGVLSRAVGIPADTLRTWEARYGFPAPRRTASGQRTYSVDSVARLRRIAEAIARGYRVSQVVGASDDLLTALLAVGSPPAASATNPSSAARSSLEALIRPVLALDASAYGAALRDAARPGLIPFLETCVPALLAVLAEAGTSGRLGLRHERFAREGLEDWLRVTPTGPRDEGRRAVLASVSPEPHALGRLMAARVLEGAGWTVISLGAECPVQEITLAARDASASAVVVGVERTPRFPYAFGRLRRLRERLGTRTSLVVTGDGAPAASRGFLVLAGISRLDAWARRRT